MFLKCLYLLNGDTVMWEMGVRVSRRTWNLIMQKLMLNKNNIVVKHEGTTCLRYLKEVVFEGGTWSHLAQNRTHEPDSVNMVKSLGSWRGEFLYQVSTYCQQFPCTVEVVVSKQSSTSNSANKWDYLHKLLFPLSQLNNKWIADLCCVHPYNGTLSCTDDKE